MPAKIYTKTGDKGETGLFGGERVRKDHPRIEAFGDVDELNAMIGLVRSVELEPDVERILEKIQNDLFEIGASLAGKGSCSVDSVYLEKAIDKMEAVLNPLKNFILPGGGGAGARLHLARTFCRRAERRVVTLAGQAPVDQEIIIYMNRLSDFLFVAARWINHKEGVTEKVWVKS